MRHEYWDIGYRVDGMVRLGSEEWGRKEKKTEKKGREEITKERKG